MSLSITDIKINNLALETGKRFESPVVKQRVRFAAITAAWKQSVPNSEVAFLATLLRRQLLLDSMLRILEEGLVYSLFPLEQNIWLFFAFDASLEACDQIVYAVIFPQASVKEITDIKKWFGNAIWNNFDVELVTNPSYRDALMPILINSIAMARCYGRTIISSFYHHLKRLLESQTRPSKGSSRVLNPARQSSKRHF